MNIFNMNMGIAYVPAARVAQKREMMSLWKNAAKLTSLWSFAAALWTAIATVVAKNSENTELLAMGFVVSAVFLLSALTVKKSKKTYFTAVLAAAFAFTSSVNLVAVGSRGFCFIIGASVLNCIPLFFAIKCLLNYDSVYKPLSLQKGFPEFIFSTADIYGDKLYLKDKEELLAEKRERESFNGLNTQEDIEAERFWRSQQQPQKEAARLTMDFVDENKVDIQPPSRRRSFSWF